MNYWTYRWKILCVTFISLWIINVGPRAAHEWIGNSIFLSDLKDYVRTTHSLGVYVFLVWGSWLLCDWGWISLHTYAFSSLLSVRLCQSLNTRPVPVFRQQSKPHPHSEEWGSGLVCVLCSQAEESSHSKACLRTRSPRPMYPVLSIYRPSSVFHTIII